MAYSAGTATVSVIPSLKGFVERVRSGVKNLGPYDVELHPDLKNFNRLVNAEMGKSFGPIKVKVEAETGALMSSLAAATRSRSVEVNADLNRASLAGIENALRSLGGTAKIDADSSAADLAIAGVRQRLADLRDKVIRLEINDQQARAELTAIDRDLSKIDNAQVSASLGVDAGAARSELAAVNSELGRFEGQTHNANLGVDPSRALAGVGLVAAAITAIRNPPPINLSMNTNGLGAATLAAASLSGALLGIGAAIPVLGGVAAAAAAIGPALAVGGAGIAATVLGFSGVGKALGALNDQQTTAGTTAKATGKAMESAAEGVRSAQQRVSQATQNLAQVQQAAADSAISAAQAVKDAQTGVADAHRNAAETARRAQQSIADASRNAARAQQTAAESVKAAIERQQGAERTLTSAVRDAARAQIALTDARNQARIALMSLSDQVIENGLAQRRAVLDLADAQRKANEATASPEGTQALQTQRNAAIALAEAQTALAGDSQNEALKQAAADAASSFTIANNALADTSDEAVRAQIAYEEQSHSLDVLRRQGAQLSKDKATADARGIEGSTQVVAAQDAIVSANERVADAQRGVASSNEGLVKAQREGATAIADAQRAVVEAQRSAAVSAADSSRTIEAAQQRVSDALRAQESQQRQAAYSIQQAQQGIADAQRAVAQAMKAAGDAATGASAGADKLGQAFANLSPAAAEFARYLFSLKPLLDDLRATAATNLFPGLTAGLAAQVAIFPVYKALVAATAAAMGEFFRIVLTGLASPFWQGFWTTIASQAMPIMTQLANLFLRVAQAVANLILAMLPAQGAFFALLNTIVTIVDTALTPLLGLWGTQLIPIVTQTAMLLVPILNLLGALTPAFVGIFNAMLPVVSTLINSLQPILVALTPFLVYFAQVVGTFLVDALNRLTPLLVTVATWLSAHPAAAIAMAQAVLFVVEAFKALAFAFGLLHTFVIIFAMKVALESLGIAVGGIVAQFAPAFAAIGRFIALVWSFLNPLNLLRVGLPVLGQALLWLGRTVLAAIGPIGWIIIALTTMYTQSEAFRGAVNGLLGALGSIVSAIVQAVMPVFTALSGVLGMIMGVFGQVVNVIAAALVPIINQLSGIISQLVGALLPPLMQVFTALAPVITLIGQVFVALVQALMPLVTLILNNLVSQLGWVMNVIQLLIPVITFLAQIWADVIVWYITNLLIPALQAVVGAIQWVGSVIGVVATAISTAWTWVGSLFSTIGAAIGVAFNAVGTAIQWVWDSIIKPVFDYFGGVIERAGWLMYALWVMYIQPIWAAISEWISAKYNELIKPIFDAIGAALAWIGQKFAEFGAWVGAKWGEFTNFLSTQWGLMGQPVIDAIGRALDWVGGKFGEFGTWVGQKWGEFTGWIKSQWDGTGNPIMKGIWDALDWVGKKFGEFGSWVGGIWDTVWKAIDGAWQKIKPIFDAVGGALSYIFGGNTSGQPVLPAVVPPPPGRANGGVVRMAMGGVVDWQHFTDGGGTLPGYAPGRDIVPSVLSPGEGVLVPEAVKALGGPAAIDAINARYSKRVASKPGLAASSGVSSMGLPGFAHGGVVAAVARFADGGVATSGGAAGASAAPSGASGTLPFTVADTQALTAAVDALTAAVQALTAAVTALTAAGALLTAMTTNLAAMTTALTGAVTANMIALLANMGAIIVLIPQITGWNFWVVTTANSLNALLSPAVIFLTNGALVPLVNYIMASVIPTFTLMELHAGVLAVNAILALAAQIPPLMAWMNQLLANIVYVWTTITNTIVTADNTIAARNNLLQQEVSAAWLRMQTDVQNSINGMQLAIDGFMAGLGRLRDAEMFTAQWTFDRFNEMKGHAGVPMHWILEFPFNAGIIAAWNSLDAQFALGKHVNPVAIPFASGGVIPGHGGGKADDVPIMASSGEFMVREKVAKQHYSFLSALNSGQTEARQAAGGARRRAYGYVGQDNPAYTRGGGGGYAAGGIIEAVARAKQWAQSQNGKPYQWGGGGNPSWDCSGFMGGITNVLRGQTPGRIGSTADFPWAGFAPGLGGQFAIGSTKNSGDGIGHMAGTLGGMNVESAGGGKGVHAGPPARGADDGLFGTKAFLQEAGGAFVSGGAGGGAAFDPTPVVEEAFKKAYAFIDEIPGRFGTSPFVAGSGGIARQAADGAKGKMLEKLMAMFATSGAALGPLGAGAQFYVAEISRAAKALALGKDAAIIGVATALTETGSLRMLANASRPDSMALPHDGVAADHDSVGLFQQRANGAWGTTAQQMNAFASASMFFRKLASFDWRGMTPGAAAQKVQVSAFPDRYQSRVAQATGLVNQFGGFDDGGMANGAGFMAKQTIRPERVLSPAQTQSFDTLVAVLGRSGVRVDSSGHDPAQSVMPDQFRISSGRLEVVDDGFVRIVDARLDAVTSRLIDGK